MAKNGNIGCAFTVALALKKADDEQKEDKIEILLAISIKKRNGVVPPPRRKCPGGRNTSQGEKNTKSEGDDLWSSLAGNILPQASLDEIASSASQKKVSDMLVIERLLALGVPEEEICPGIMNDTLVRLNVSHREFQKETGNRLPDVAERVFAFDISTPLTGGKIQTWQLAIINRDLFKTGVFREEADEMLPFEWFSLEEALSCYAKGVKLTPMHTAAIARGAAKLCDSLREEAYFDRDIGRFHKALSSDLEYGLRNLGHSNCEALAENIEYLMSTHDL